MPRITEIQSESRKFIPAKMVNRYPLVGGRGTEACARPAEGREIEAFNERAMSLGCSRREWLLSIHSESLKHFYG